MNLDGAPATGIGDANDMRFLRPQGFNSGEQFFQYLKDSFDTLYAEGDSAPAMMSVGLHCRVIGRLGRFQGLVRFLQYVLQHEDVWICRGLDIARHWYKEHDPTSDSHHGKMAHWGSVVMGPDVASGQRLQLHVPGGVWKASQLLEGPNGYGLVSEAVSPGFGYEDMTLGEAETLRQNFPEYGSRERRKCLKRKW